MINGLDRHVKASVTSSCLPSLHGPGARTAVQTTGSVEPNCFSKKTGETSRAVPFVADSARVLSGPSVLTARTGVDAETDRPVCKLAVRSDSLMVLGTVRVQVGAGKAGVSVQAHTFPCGASYVRIVRLRHLLCHNFWKVYGLLAARGSRRYHRTAPASIVSQSSV